MVIKVSSSMTTGYDRFCDTSDSNSDADNTASEEQRQPRLLAALSPMLRERGETNQRCAWSDAPRRDNKAFLQPLISKMPWGLS
jgi:hypothetical protein